ncbi:hypothetical protein COC42_09505 [Sphingomonas spermidinifaciens]|uniref:Uncharacterized protein n=1 Tax=Sphingomonas spermidinifaciens TaxID=1141889 RepID=A0A2A4BA17_9SPHN|nr:hypothetical protein [Sphingomonas spermidinifaciens]PCD04474.1 hypothetical protein COC42_09505 [Sphingomonas spermidinifaciens]
MSIVLALLLAASPAPQGGLQDEVIVVGETIQKAERDLAGCIAARCPPAEEVRATLALAEAQYLDGDVQAARATAKAGLKRNRRFASSIPIELSGLVRTSARMAAHLGLTDEMRHETINNAVMLRKHAGADHRQAMIARAEMGDSFVQTGRALAAREIYADMARDAARLGVRDMEGLALLRLAALDLQIARLQRTRGENAARTIDYLRESRVPEHAVYGQAATVLDAVMRAQDGDETRLDAAIDELRATPSPQLIFAPPIRLGGAFAAAELNGSAPRLGEAGNYAPYFAEADNWFDVGFLINPDGRVSDIQILRSGKRFDGRWYPAVQRSLIGRRYTPSAGHSAKAGTYRVERFSMTFPLAQGRHTRLVTRGLTPLISRTDVTADPETATS